MQFAGRGLAERLYSAIDDHTVTAVVRTALAGGINWFDTAEMYGRGNSERLLTAALHQLGRAPGEVVIATKWSPGLRSASSIGRTIDTRLVALQGFPIDLHQIHMPYGGFSPISSQIRAMAELHRAGKITSVGVSNFSARQMEKASRLLRADGLSLASNQVRISLLHRAIEHNGVLETARRLGVTLIAYSPLGSGLLTGAFHDDPGRVRSLPRMRRVFGQFDAEGLARTAPLIDGLRAIGQAHGVSAAQVALNWLINFYGETVVAIPGASKAHHAEQSAGAMDLRLSEREVAHIDELSNACTRQTPSRRLRSAPQTSRPAKHVHEPRQSLGPETLP